MGDRSTAAAPRPPPRSSLSQAHTSTRSIAIGWSTSSRRSPIRRSGLCTASNAGTSARSTPSARCSLPGSATNPTLRRTTRSATTPTPRFGARSGNVLPYDESLTGLEDIAWARAAMSSDTASVYEPAAEVVHVHEETAARLFNRYRREAIALKDIFPEERFSLWDFCRLFSGNVASDLYHARMKASSCGAPASVFVFRLMQFWGTYRGFARHGAVTSRLRRTFYYPRSRGRVPSEPDRAARSTASSILAERRRTNRTGRTEVGCAGYPPTDLVEVG